VEPASFRNYSGQQEAERLPELVAKKNRQPGFGGDEFIFQLEKDRMDKNWELKIDENCRYTERMMPD
jgi:hypothetical protein